MSLPRAHGREPTRTEVYTLFTDATGVTRLIYTAETWTTLRMTLETAGPVSVGTRENLGNVLSGQGMLLPTGREREWTLPPGQRFFWVAESINRVTLSVEQPAFGQDIVDKLEEVRQAEFGVNVEPKKGIKGPGQVEVPPPASLRARAPASGPVVVHARIPGPRIPR